MYLGSRGLGTGLLGLGSRGRDNRGLVSEVLGLHVVGDLLQARSDSITLVEGTEHGGHIGTLGSTRGRGRRSGKVSRGRRRGARRGRGSTRRSRGSNFGRGSISTLGVPCQSSGVEVLDVVGELLEECVEESDPLDLILVTVGCVSECILICCKL